MSRCVALVAADRFAPAIRPHAPEAEVRVLDGASHLGLVGEARLAEDLVAWIAASAP